MNGKLTLQQFEQLKKQKEKSKKAGNTKKRDETLPAKDESSEQPAAEEPDHTAESSRLGDAADKADQLTAPSEKSEGTEEPSDMSPATMHNRQPSLSLQSRMRSSSFRRTSGSQPLGSPTLNGSKSPILSPEGDAVTEIYRKQAARLDELERENKRLAKEFRETETRWKKTEEELEELREASSEVAELKTKAEKAAAQADELAKVKSENASLQRQNAQLQSQSTRNTRHASSPSTANAPGSSPSSDLQAQLDSKSSTIESMEMEISNLRSQLSKSTTSSASHSEQISALESKVDRAERAAGSAQRELADAKKNLERASEKAVKEGSERTSAETKIRSLSREAEESKQKADDSIKRVEILEKKLAALTNLHKESDGRRQTGEREAAEMRRRFATLENENLRLREERERSRKREATGGQHDEDLDELEDEERMRLETKIRHLEGEIFDLKRGVWRERRRTLGSADGSTDGGPASPGSKFDEIDLSGPSPFAARRQSNAARGQGGFTNVLSSGFSAFTGGRRESLGLLDDDGEDAFDEDAFRVAQEEESRKRVERVREVKRGLKEWEGWRMDVVDVRVGVGGAEEIFDV